jgi:hypothetical protein
MKLRGIDVVLVVAGIFLFMFALWSSITDDGASEAGAYHGMRTQLTEAFEVSGEPIPERSCEPRHVVEDMQSGQRAYTDRTNFVVDNTGQAWVNQYGVVTPYRSSQDMTDDAVGVVRMSDGSFKVFASSQQWDEASTGYPPATFSDDREYFPAEAVVGNE